VPPTGPRRTHASVSVLLVEGPSEARWQLAAALRQEGYGVEEAEDSAELRDYLDSGLGVATRDGLPDLLIVDTDFVGKPGVEVLLELRKTYRHIPVILLSKSFNREAVRKAGALDAAYLFQKPSDTETVVLAALNLLDPGERKRRATALRWLGWHQGVRVRSPKDTHH
jgi:DNA-binding response OmpR family regulator